LCGRCPAILRGQLVRVISALRIVPLDEDDTDNVERCIAYSIAIEPIG